MPNTYSPDWILNRSSTLYMDGTSIYYLRMPGEPGQRAHLRLDAQQAEALSTVIRACLETECPPHGVSN